MSCLDSSILPHLAYDLRTSSCGLKPVVVVASTDAVVYAFFSTVVAIECASASLISIPRLNAKDSIFCPTLETVSARCSFERDHALSAIFQYFPTALLEDAPDHLEDADNVYNWFQRECDNGLAERNAAKRQKRRCHAGARQDN